MKPTSSLFPIFGLALLGAAASVAQEGERRGPPPEGEGRGRAGEYLKRADTDADGKVSKAEFEAMSRGDVDERFARMDGNKDGYVDATEMAAIAERLREGMRGRPGGEGEGFRRPPGGERPDGAPRPEGERPRRPDGERPEGGRPEGGRPPQGGPAGGPMIDEVFGRMDKNGDGSVDKAEYLEFSTKEVESRFGRADENADGKLTKDEMRAGLERLRGMMRGPQGGPPGEGGFRRPPAGEGGPRGEGGFRRPPPVDGDAPRPAEAPKKDPA